MKNDVTKYDLWSKIFGEQKGNVRLTYFHILKLWWLFIIECYAPNIEHGGLQNISQRNTHVTSKLSGLYCDRGYTAEVDVESITCEADRIWRPIFICQKGKSRLYFIINLSTLNFPFKFSLMKINDKQTYKLVCCLITLVEKELAKLVSDLFVFLNNTICLNYA